MAHPLRRPRPSRSVSSNKPFGGDRVKLFEPPARRAKAIRRDGSLIEGPGPGLIASVDRRIPRLPVRATTAREAYGMPAQGSVQETCAFLRLRAAGGGVQDLNRTDAENESLIYA